MPDPTPLASMRLDAFLSELGAKSPTPGGGAVASLVGAVAAALGEMVVHYSVGKRSLAEFEPRHRAALMRLARARTLLLALADEDAEAYALMNELARLPEDHPRRVGGWDEAVRASVQVPMSVAAGGVELLRVLDELRGTTNKHLRSDLAISALLADAAVRSARWNVLVNAPSLPDEGERTHASRQLNYLIGESARLAGVIEQSCAS